MKGPFAMQEIDFRQGRHTLDSVEVLRYKISLPTFSQQSRISDFYSGIADSIVGYCETELKEISEKKYKESELPNKKFYYRPINYSLDGKITYSDKNVIFVLLTAAAKIGNEYIGGRVYDAHAWSPVDQLLIPPKQAARLFMPSGKLLREVKSAEGVFVSDGKLFVCNKNSITEICSL